MLYEGIVSNSIFDKFSIQNGVTLMNHASNTSTIEDTLAVAKVLCPDFIEIEGCVFLSEFYNDNIDALKNQFDGHKKRIEMFVNSWALGDFFVGAYSESVENNDLLNEFANTLVYFWRRRLKEVFPNKKVVVETGENLMGESGLTITIYQL